MVDFNKTEGTLEISIKVFADDLLLGLKEAGASKVYLGEKKENPDTDKYIFNYLKSNLKFTVNDNPEQYTFVGREMESDVVWIYLEIDQINQLKKIEIDCGFLTEVLETQSNIIQINDGNEIKSLLLNRRKQNDSIKL